MATEDGATVFANIPVAGLLVQFAEAAVERIMMAAVIVSLSCFI